MNRVKFTILIVFCCCSCSAGDPGINPYPLSGSIPPPAGYHRTSDNDPFTAWLRAIPLKRDRTVRLFDGSLKKNQQAQFAVLDVSVGNQDLQQCADAVMRLRSEYLHSRKDDGNICFYTNQGVRLSFLEWTRGRRFHLTGGRLTPYQLQVQRHCEDRACFDEYLQTVFAYCGTLSLEKQLSSVSRYKDIRPGDVLITGGSPGHAMLVIDMAVDAAGRKAYLLAQSYMPAQDIHIVKNPAARGQDPWFYVDDETHVIPTPEWTFYPSQLRRWPEKITFME